MVNILVVEDDVKLNQIVCTFLNDNGYHAKGCLNVDDAYDAMYDASYSLIISDIMMPGIDGFEFAETIRDTDKDIPILFMTAKDDIPSMQKGFRIGVDDYMVKPVKMAELILRVGALLRRAKISSEKQLNISGLTLDAEGMSASVGDEEIPLTLREFNLLFKLLSNPNHAFSRQKLMDEFWGMESETSLRAVDNYITRLRDKFAGFDGFKITTVHGLGYKAELK